MAKSIYQSLVLTLLSFLFLSPSSAHDKNLPVDFKGSFSTVYAFGDSYTDTGNAKFLGGFNTSVDAKNIPLEKLKSLVLGTLGTLGGNPMNPSNGKLMVDFLCDALSVATPVPYKEPSANFSTGVNFAVAGSTFIPSDYFVGKNLSTLFWKGLPKNFQTQMNWFDDFQTKAGCKGKNMASCKAHMQDSLFWIGEMGINDYTRAIGSSVSLQWLSEISVRTVSKLLKTLLAAGAKYIVVQGLPPVGCLPIDISLCPLKNLNKMGCAAAVNSAIMIHNQILQRSLENLRKINPSCTIVYADYWNAYLTILKNPKKFQIEEPFKACCGSGGSGSNLNFNKHELCGSPGATVCKDPSKYISWDGIHLTEAMYKHVSDLFLNQGFCQPSFDELIKSKKSM